MAGGSITPPWQVSQQWLVAGAPAALSLGVAACLPADLVWSDDALLLEEELEHARTCKQKVGVATKPVACMMPHCCPHLVMLLRCDPSSFLLLPCPSPNRCQQVLQVLQRFDELCREQSKVGGQVTDTAPTSRHACLPCPAGPSQRGSGRCCFITFQCPPASSTPTATHPSNSSSIGESCLVPSPHRGARCRLSYSSLPWQTFLGRGPWVCCVPAWYGPAHSPGAHTV